jgi:transposase
MAARFISVDRDTDDPLPAGHLARFVVDVVNHPDSLRLESAYSGRVSTPHHSSVLLGLLIYGYASGVYSNRAIERATHDSMAFRSVAANRHPDHDTINTFSKLLWDEIESAFWQVLRIAAGMKRVKLGMVSLDGTRIKAKASKHSALSHGLRLAAGGPDRSRDRSIEAPIQG